MTRARFIILFVVLSLAACTRLPNTISPDLISDQPSRISFYFKKTPDIAEQVAMATAMVTAADMDTITRQLTVTDTSVTGTIDSIPAGRNRKFEIFAYNADTVLTYYGFTFADVQAGTIVRVNIILYPVETTGTVIIVGTFSPYPRTEERIVFVADYTGLNDVYIVDADGSNLTNLTNTPNIAEFYPRISPDRQKIVFLRNVAGINRPFLMNIDGSDVTELNILPGSRVSFCSWSPDGKKLAVSSDYDGDFEVYVYDLTTGATTQLTYNQATETIPIWSPSGDWIGYQTNEKGLFKVNLIHPDGTDRHELLPNAALEEKFPSFSPVADLITFYARSNYITWDLFTCKTDGSELTQLTYTPNIDENHQCWSPDGKHLMFSQYMNFDIGLYLLNLETGAITQFIDDPNANEDFAHWR